MINTEHNYDFVTVWACHGDCGSRTQLSPRMSGRITGAQDTTRWTSHTGLMQVVFTSNGSVTEGGFIMLWGLHIEQTVCSACARGKYKDSWGRGWCADCPANSGVGGTGSASVSVARMCGPAQDQRCPTELSSTHGAGPAHHGNDGITNSDGNFADANSDGSEWFRIDFQQTRQLDHIIFFNRACCADRSNGAKIRVDMSLDPFQNTRCAVLNGNGGAQTHSCHLKGRYIFITQSGQWLNFNELQLFEPLAPNKQH